MRFIDPTGLDSLSDTWAEQDAADEENDSYFTESELADLGYGYEGYLATPEDMAGAGRYNNSSNLDLVGEPTTQINGNTTTTKSTFADGSYSISETVKHDTKSGVSKETTTTCTFDSDGNVISSINITTYSKEGTSVEVHSYTAGNVTTTWYEINDPNGNGLLSGHVEDIAVIGLRGWGSGFNPEPGKSRGEHPYDDAFLVTTKDGRVGFFDKVNLEGSTAKFQGTKSYHDGTNPRIADGVFTINYGYHSGYEALRVNNDLRVDIQGKNPNKDYNYMKGCEIHMGGNDWNWSEGCLTVYQSEWSDFMSYFSSNPNHVLDGQVAGTLIITTL